MNKNKQFCGIDISEDVFDVVDHEDNLYQFLSDFNASFTLFPRRDLVGSNPVPDFFGFFGAK